MKTTHVVAIVETELCWTVGSLYWDSTNINKNTESISSCKSVRIKLWNKTYWKSSKNLPHWVSSNKKLMKKKDVLWWKTESLKKKRRDIKNINGWFVGSFVKECHHNSSKKNTMQHQCRPTNSLSYGEMIIVLYWTQNLPCKLWGRGGHADWFTEIKFLLRNSKTQLSCISNTYCGVVLNEGVDMTVRVRL